MGHDHRGEGARAERLLQPENALHIKVVRRFVQQQHVGLQRQSPRDGQPLALAAGERGGLPPEFLKSNPAQRHLRRKLDLVLIVELRRRVVLHGLDHGGQNGGPFREPIRLRDVRHADAAADGQRAAVGGFQAGDDLEQRGLARAVGADEGQPLLFIDADADAGEERAGAKGLGEVLCGEGDGHGATLGQPPHRRPPPRAPPRPPPPPPPRQLLMRCSTRGGASPR